MFPSVDTVSTGRDTETSLTRVTDLIQGKGQDGYLLHNSREVPGTVHGGGGTWGGVMRSCLCQREEVGVLLKDPEGKWELVIDCRVN